MENQRFLSKSVISDKDAYTDLIPVLVKCFAIILIGYISGACGLINVKGAKALNTFITYFALPALIFSSLVAIDFTNVRWTFLASVFIAKTIAFIVVVLVTLILSHPTNSGLAGLYGIFCTQSNDLALGYPLVSSLYDKTNNAYLAQYIYLLVPIQLLIINPTAFFIMEIDKQGKRQMNSKTKKNIFWPVLRGILTNPIIIMTMLGIAGNFAFNRQPPKLLMNILETLGFAFPALALFQLGQSMVGKMSTLYGYKLVEPAVLILVKILVLPLLIRELVHVMPTGFTNQEKDDFGSFGFLYGTFPTAPNMFLYANQFDLDSHIVATGMVACTVASAPWMLISAKMTTLPISDFSKLRLTLIETVFWLSIASFVCCIWVLIRLIIEQKWKNLTHCLTINLIVAQAITAMGGILWNFVQNSSGSTFYAQYIISASGLCSTRILTALQALILASIQWKSLCYVLSYRTTILAFVNITSLLFTLALVVGIFFRPPKKYIPDPNFQYGEPEAYVSFALLSLCLVLVIVGLITQQRLHLKNYQLLNTIEDSNLEHFEEKVPDFQVPDLEDLSSLGCCSERMRKRCTSEARQLLMEGCQKDEINYQLESQNHVVLLILLSISMVIGTAACIWKLVGEDQTGIFLEIEFLDIILGYGQGIFTFIVFGLNYEFMIRPAVRIYYSLRYGTANFALPSFNELETSTLNTCRTFHKYHYESCVSELESEKRVGRKVYFSAFRGKELVTWLIAIGLAEDRKEGESYGKELLLGRVIQSVNNVCSFRDDMEIYIFLPKSIHVNAGASDIPAAEKLDLNNSDLQFLGRQTPSSMGSIQHWENKTEVQLHKDPTVLL